MDDIYRKRQREEGGPDPFQDALAPEGDPARSASGAGDGDGRAAEEARELRRRKHREFHETVRPPATTERRDL